MGTVKTTVEIPDALFRDAKVAAAQAGIPMKQFLTEAVRDRLRRRGTGPPGAPQWKVAFGGLSELHRENLRLDRLIAREFGGN
jgi:hypothetical protein